MAEQANPASLFLSTLDVGDSLLSFRASRAVDRILAERDEAEAAIAGEDVANHVSLSVRCGSCGVIGYLFEWNHLPGCALDRTLTPKQRWRLRHPARAIEAQRRRRRSARKLAIKRRWAVLNGRCGSCTRATAEPGRRWCRPCLDAAAEAHRRRYYELKAA